MKKFATMALSLIALTLSNNLTAEAIEKPEYNLLRYALPTSESQYNDRVELLKVWHYYREGVDFSETSQGEICYSNFAIMQPDGKYMNYSELATITKNNKELDVLGLEDNNMGPGSQLMVLTYPDYFNTPSSIPQTMCYTFKLPEHTSKKYLLSGSAISTSKNYIKYNSNLDYFLSQTESMIFVIEKEPCTTSFKLETIGEARALNAYDKNNELLNSYRIVLQRPDYAFTFNLNFEKEIYVPEDCDYFSIYAPFQTSVISNLYLLDYNVILSDVEEMDMAEEADPIYYDLSGRKTDPEVVERCPGFYIERRGTESKVIRR